MIENNSDITEEKPLKPISEKILSYYYPYGNTMFEKDNISLITQSEFEIGYDDMSKRITIPIRDEYSNLVGVKGRFIDEILDENIPKYLSLERYAKSQVLYGLYKTFKYIKEKDFVIVVESEKGVLQLWEAGYKNVVSTGGSTISKVQIDKLTRLCVPVYFAFDKDIDMEKLKEIANKFVSSVDIFALYDKEDLLNEKESPSDDISKFDKLMSNVIRLERE